MEVEPCYQLKTAHTRTQQVSIFCKVIKTDDKSFQENIPFVENNLVSVSPFLVLLCRASFD